MLGLERQAPQRIDKRPPPSAGDDAYRDWRERRAISRRSRLIDGAAGECGHRGDGGDIGGLALIGRHAKRGVTLEMLDGDVAFARREGDVLQRHIVLEIDPAPPFVVGLRPGGLDSVTARRRVRRGALAAAGRVPLAQRLRECEGAVGGAGDRQVFNPAQWDESRAPLVIKQASARLSVEMHGRRPSAGEQQRVAIMRPPAGANHFDPPSSDDALYGGAVRDVQSRHGSSSARVENLDRRASLGQGLRDNIGAVVISRDHDLLADQHAEAPEVDNRRVGRHHARPIVVGDDKRPLNRASRDHDLLRADAPERVRLGHATLPSADEIPVVDAVGRRSSQDPPACRFHGARHAESPVAPAAAFDRAAAMDELAADLGMVVNEEHGVSRSSGSRSRSETRGTSADDKQIAARVELRIVGWRPIVRIDAAEAGHGADRAFKGLPARP